MAEERRGAAVVVWRRTDRGPEFLLLHRSGADERGPWCWTFPSGGCHDGESFEDCARRELREETGLELEITPVPGDYPVFVAQAPEGVDVVLEDGDREHDRADWLGEDEACALLMPAAVADSLRSVARVLPH